MRLSQAIAATIGAAVDITVSEPAPRVPFAPMSRRILLAALPRPCAVVCLAAGGALLALASRDAALAWAAVSRLAPWRPQLLPLGAAPPQGAPPELLPCGRLGVELAGRQRTMGTVSRVLRTLSDVAAASRRCTSGGGGGGLPANLPAPYAAFGAAGARIAAYVEVPNEAPGNPAAMATFFSPPGRAAPYAAVFVAAPGSPRPAPGAPPALADAFTSSLLCSLPRGEPEIEKWTHRLLVLAGGLETRSSRTRGAGSARHDPKARDAYAALLHARADFLESHDWDPSSGRLVHRAEAHAVVAAAAARLASPAARAAARNDVAALAATTAHVAEAAALTSATPDGTCVNFAALPDLPRGDRVYLLRDSAGYTPVPYNFGLLPPGADGRWCGGAGAGAGARGRRRAPPRAVISFRGSRHSRCSIRASTPTRSPAAARWGGGARRPCCWTCGRCRDGARGTRPRRCARRSRRRPRWRRRTRRDSGTCWTRTCAPRWAAAAATSRGTRTCTPPPARRWRPWTRPRTRRRSRPRRSRASPRSVPQPARTRRARGAPRPRN